MFRILYADNIAGNLIELRVSAPQIAKKAKPGQFVIVRTDEEGERIPLTIADSDKKKGTITLIVQPIGRSTKKMALLKKDDFLLDIAGPLGKESDIEKKGTVVCIGGGVGIAPIYPIVRALSEAGNRVITIMGARNKDLIFWQEKLSMFSEEVFVTTDDGSLGHHGFVTDILKDLLEKEKIDKVWAVGPMIMMRTVAEVTRKDQVETVVSLNPIMIDGTGMCGGCRVQVGNETRFACVDGPEFDGHLVDFDLAMNRAGFYKKEEKDAVESHTCRLGGDCKCH